MSRRNFFEQNRKRLTRLIVILGVVFALLTEHSWPSGGAIHLAFHWLGYLLVLTGVLGRLWATLYIGGSKNDTLMTDGPYSIVRNPLYFFSFLAGLGVCVSLENLVLIAAFVAAFSLYYPSLIRAEEARLRSLFGAEFDAYTASVPAFMPRPSLFKTQEAVSFRPKLLMRALGDSAVFLLAIPAADLIEKLHETGILPAYWNIP